MLYHQNGTAKITFFLEQTNDFTEIIMQYPTNLSTLSTFPFREPYVSRCGTVRFA